MRKPAKGGLRLPFRWDGLRGFLQGKKTRRLFAGRFLSNNTKIIQTAGNPPRRRQKVKTRQRVVVARKKKLGRVASSGIRFLLLGSAAAALIIHILGYLFSSPRFSITHIGVSGNKHVTAQAIIGQSGISEGRNIFRVKLADSAAAIEKIPRILSASVQRKLPNQIQIEIRERDSAALVLSDKLLYVDGQAKVIAEYDCSEDVDAPIITGRSLSGLEVGDSIAEIEGIAEAFEIISAMHDLGLSRSIRISEINVDNPANILMVEKESGANIFLGSGDFRGKLWRLAKVAEEINRNNRLRIVDLERVDMRFEGIVPAKF